LRADSSGRGLRYSSFFGFLIGGLIFRYWLRLAECSSQKVLLACLALPFRGARDFGPDHLCRRHAVRGDGGPCDDHRSDRALRVFVHHDPAHREIQVARRFRSDFGDGGVVNFAEGRLGFGAALEADESFVRFFAPARTRWYEYAIRFLFGGTITVITGLVAKRYGPVFGWNSVGTLLTALVVHAVISNLALAQTAGLLLVQIGLALVGS
jgi:hypothetical protein